jgi:ribosomal protein L32
MQPWVWLTAYVLGFGLLQVMLYRHFSGGTPATETTEGRATRADGGRALGAETTDSVTCPHCGTTNESHRMIRYCGSCARSLR